MQHYPRSVLFRIAGVVAGLSLWLGLIVLALNNFDTPAGFLDDVSATWPFWVVAAVAIAAAFVAWRRLGPGPGWGAFAIGFVASFVALLVNAQAAAGWGLFWVVIAFAVLVPLPGLGRSRSSDPGV